MYDCLYTSTHEYKGNGVKLEIIEKEKNQPIHEWVYLILRANIIKLILEPGQIISENEVSEMFKASRTPVRQAFIRLAEEGLLEVQPQKNSFVSLIDMEQADDARFMRLAMEKSILKEACHNFTEVDRKLIEANIEIQEKYRVEQKYGKMIAVDDEFHRFFYKSCGRERVWIHIKKLNYNFDRLRTMSNQIDDTLRQVIEEHRIILETVVQGRSSEIDEIIEHHLTRAVIDKVVFNYPPQYFKQDLYKYFQITAAGTGSTGDSKRKEVVRF